MISEYERRVQLARALERAADSDTLQQRCSSGRTPPPLRPRHAKRNSTPSTQRHWKILRSKVATPQSDQELLFGVGRVSVASHTQHGEDSLNAQLPVGVAGPLRIRGTHACGDYCLPMATTDAELVAAYLRGAVLLTKAGGCTCTLLSEGLTRYSGFAFANESDIGRFIAWVTDSFAEFKRVSEASSQHVELCNMYVQVDVENVYLAFEFTSGDAAGQDMVEIATDAISIYINQRSAVRPLRSLVEADSSGDAVAGTLPSANMRGKKVISEAIVPASLIETMLHTTPKSMSRTCRMNALDGAMSGTLGTPGHYANALTALYIATGQDVARVSDSAMGLTRMELTGESSLYAAVTLPNLFVGPVGDGGGLSTQQAGLQIANSQGIGSAQQMAEICAAMCLAGELSITGLIAAGELPPADQSWARAERR